MAEYKKHPDGTVTMPNGLRYRKNPDGTWTQVEGEPPPGNDGTHPPPGDTYTNPDNYKNGFISPQSKKATADYMAYVKWKRQELANLMQTYRTEAPKQIEAFQKAALGELDIKAPEMWGQRHVNLQQRGLEESPNFLAGAKQSQENWLTGERQGIKDQAWNMKQQNNDAMLAALGKPDYAGNYNNWRKYNQDMTSYLDWMRTKKEGNK